MTHGIPNPSLRLILWVCAIASTINIQTSNFSMGIHVPIIIILALLVRNRESTTENLKILIGWSILFSLHFLFSLSITPCSDLESKSFYSFSIFLILFYSISRIASVPHTKPITWDLKAIVLLVTVSLIFDLLTGLAQTGGEALRGGGIYPEPSHLALTMSPILVGLMLAKESSARAWGWVGFIVMTILSASATIFVMVLLCFFVVILARSKRQFSLVPIFQLMLIFAFITFMIQNSAYVGELESRFNGLVQISTSSNLSSLVYINGWETAFKNLQETDGFGLGFNRMGCAPRPVTNTGYILNAIGLVDYNASDGSFILSKLISELGLFGIMTWLGASVALFRLMFKKTGNRFSATSPDVQALILSGITVVTFGSVFRGINYFSGYFVFGIFCTLLALQSPRSINKKLPE